MWVSRQMLLCCAFMFSLVSGVAGQDWFQHERLIKVMMTHPAAPGDQAIYLEFAPEGDIVFLGPRYTFDDVPSQPVGRNARPPRTRPYDVTVAAYRIDSGQPVHKYVCMPRYGKKMNRCYAADLSPDGKHLAVSTSGTEDLRLYVFDVASGKPKYVSKGRGHAGVAFVNGSRQVVTAGRTSPLYGVLMLHDLASQQIVKKQEFNRSDLSSSLVCRSTAAGNRVAVGRSVWDIPSWKMLFGQRTTGDFLLYDISADGQQTVSGKLKRIVLWNGEQEEEIEVGKGYVQCADVAPSGRHVAVGSNQSVYIVDLLSRSVIEEISVHLRDVCAVAFSPDGKRLASAGADGATCIWDVSDIASSE